MLFLIPSSPSKPSLAHRTVWLMWNTTLRLVLYQCLSVECMNFTSSKLSYIIFLKAFSGTSKRCFKWRLFGNEFHGEDYAGLDLGLAPPSISLCLELFFCFPLSIWTTISLKFAWSQQIESLYITVDECLWLFYCG